MKALVKRHAAVGLWLEDIPEPTIGINDVLIRIKKTGICGTDVHIYKWDAWAQKTIPVPMVVGHEFVGEIVAVGPGRWDEDGEKRIPLDVAEGDTVIYSKYGGTEIKYNGEEYLILSARDVLAVVNK